MENAIIVSATLKNYAANDLILVVTVAYGSGMEQALSRTLWSPPAHDAAPTKRRPKDGAEWLSRFLRVAGCKDFADLPGSYVRVVDGSRERITAVRHILVDDLEMTVEWEAEEL